MVNNVTKHVSSALTVFVKHLYSQYTNNNNESHSQVKKKNELTLQFRPDEYAECTCSTRPPVMY